MNTPSTFPGSARGPHVGLKPWPSLRVRCSGASPKQAFIFRRQMPCVERNEKVRDREDALASTRSACAPPIK
jgi:hypothetical protein